jgi:hypothetical protein
MENWERLEIELLLSEMNAPAEPNWFDRLFLRWEAWRIRRDARLAIHAEAEEVR